MAWLLPPLPPTFEAALRDVRAQASAARVAAANRLGTSDDDELAPALTGLLALAHDTDARVRAAALRALKELGPRAEAAALDCVLERLDDADALVRELAVVTLSAFDSARVHNALLRALRSPHPEVRFQAVASLAESSDDDDARALSATLRDADAKVRANAARSLGRFGSAMQPALRQALADEDRDVRIEAALSLARVGDAFGATALRDALDHADFTIEALDAIGALELRQHAEAVAAIAESVLRPLALKVAAARALIRMHDARGVPALRDVLRAFRSDARSFAVQIVAELGVQELVDELVRLARRPRGADPQGLVEALVALLPKTERAREGLRVLGRRSDQAGELARASLAQPPADA